MQTRSESFVTSVFVWNHAQIKPVCKTELNKYIPLFSVIFNATLSLFFFKDQGRGTLETDQKHKEMKTLKWSSHTVS